LNDETNKIDQEIHEIESNIKQNQNVLYMLQEPFNEDGITTNNMKKKEMGRKFANNLDVKLNHDEESCQETQEEDFKILPFMQVHPTEERISKFIDIFMSTKGSK
jgi:hypothetical protein